MDSLFKNLGYFAFGIIILFILRATIMPKTFANETVNIPQNSYWSECFIYNTAQKIVIDMESQNNQSIKAALLPKSEVYRLKNSPLSSVATQYNHSLIKGQLTTRIGAGEEWCVIGIPNHSSVVLKYKIQNYFRL